MNRLSLPDRARILGCLTEGTSMRATSRLCEVSINTVTKLLVDLGTACAIYQNETLRNLPCKRLQLDEIWSFCSKKQKNVAPWREGILGQGDVWTWMAICADTKLVPTWLVGKRDAFYADVFVKDLAGRLAVRPQVTTDGLKLYLKPIDEVFGVNVDYAMLVKLYGGDSGREAQARYSPAQCLGTRTVCITGTPDPAHISTSFAERQNLTMRMSMRRFTRLTNAFSKKVDNHKAALALYFMHYNFARIHKTLRVTPAMEAGVADHVWSLEEIARLTG
ncbi:MAG: IS1 family transposase [Betaproteobacteria bacterium]|nr:IS1 family transposase [Betaproteobacteria bacterium]